MIRRDSWHGSLLAWTLAARYGVHWRLVREMLTTFTAIQPLRLGRPKSAL